MMSQLQTLPKAEEQQQQPKSQVAPSSQPPNSAQNKAIELETRLQLEKILQNEPSGNDDFDDLLNDLASGRIPSTLTNVAARDSFDQQDGMIIEFQFFTIQNWKLHYND
jgi:hypothetical protein